MKVHKIAVALVCTALVLISVSTFAQKSSGVLDGTVTDPAGSIVPGVTVKLIPKAEGQPELVTVTNARGRFQFNRLPPRNYDIVFELEGFKTVKYENIEIEVGGAWTLNIVMEISSSQEEVIVTAEAPTIEIEVVRSECGPPQGHLDVGAGYHFGYSAWALGDFNTTQATITSEAALDPDLHPDITVPSGSLWYNMRIFAEYGLSNAGRIGVGTGYDTFSGGLYRDETTANWDGFDYRFNEQMDLSASSFPIDLYYMIPCNFNQRLSWRGNVGIDIFSAKIDYECREQGPDFFLSNRGELNDSGVGYHASVGAEYCLFKNLTVIIDLGYRSMKADDFTGTLENERGDQEDVRLTMRTGDLGESFRLHPADQDLDDDTRNAVIDLSGFHTSIGFEYRIPIGQLNITGKGGK